MATTPETPPPLADPPTRAALMPILHAELNKLAESQPGPQAKSKLADVITLLQAVLASPEVIAIIPTAWKVYIAAAAVVLPLLGGFAGRWTAPPTVCPPSPIITPAAQSLKMVVYITAGMDAQKLLADPVVKNTLASVSVDPKMYSAGDVYPFGGKNVPVPCAAILKADGTVLDVSSFSTAADLVEFSKRNQGK